jgi:hypothetical protein
VNGAKVDGACLNRAEARCLDRDLALEHGGPEPGQVGRVSALEVDWAIRAMGIGSPGEPEVPRPGRG